MKHTVLVGNDINNINNAESWKNLLEGIQQHCKTQIDNLDYIKPFPLFYEEIFLNSAPEHLTKELELKKFIARRIKEIKPNEIHTRIQGLNIEDVLTTNYDFTLEGKFPTSSTAIIEERMYSVFRHFTVGSKRFWHVHGDIKKPASITLGFEQYGGQLQKLRNYVATGTDYASKKVPKRHFAMRFRSNPNQPLLSWADLFFTSHIHIFGLGLEFVESDLWWLLTYRSRLIRAGKTPIHNELFYYSPAERKNTDKAKLDLMQAMGMKVVFIDEIDRLAYYHAVLDRIQENIPSL